MPTSLQIKIWSVLVYVIVATWIAVWLHEGMSPSTLLIAAGAFG